MKNRFFYILLLLNLFANAQNKRIDSLKQLIITCNVDTIRVNLLNELSNNLKNVKEFDSAIKASDNAIILSSKINFSKGLANAYNRKGNVYNNISEFSKGLVFYAKELAIRKLINDEVGIASANNGIGNSYCALDSFAKALHHYVIALEIRKKLGLSKDIARSYNSLGNVYGGKRNFKKALSYYMLSHNIHLKNNDSLGLSQSYNSLGNTYNALGKFSEAKFFYEKALAIRLKFKDDENIAMAYNHLGNCFLALNNITKAMDYYKQAVFYSNKVNFKPVLCGSYGNLGELNYRLGKYRESIEYLNKALIIAEDLKNNGLIMNQCRRLKDNYYKLKDYEKAYLYLNKYLEAYKIDNSQSNAVSLAKVEMNYEFQLKQNATENKLNIEREQQNSKIRLRNNIIITILISIILLGLLLFYFFKNYKNNKELQHEKQIQQAENQERVRLAQDLHDDLGGTLSALKLNVTSKNTNEERTISILNKAIEDLRCISHKLMPIDFENTGINMTLQHYINTLNASNLHFKYFFDGNDTLIKKDRQLLIYRIILELTNNVIKHSRAKNCTIQGIIFKNKISFTIEDDGNGFDNSVSYNGIGLKNIQQRIQILNGKIDIDSNKNGTIVMFEVPII